jgi:ATP-dependent DNA helicase RecQ
MNAVPKAQIRKYLEHLESAGYLRTDINHGGVELTATSANVLYHGEQVKMPQADALAETIRRNRKPVIIETSSETDLFAVLKSLRYKIAGKEGLPAYIVFSNASLVDMVRKSPKTMKEFMGVSGVGEAKAKRYGEAFLAAIASFQDGE